MIPKRDQEQGQEAPAQTKPEEQAPPAEKAARAKPAPKAKAAALPAAPAKPRRAKAAQPVPAAEAAPAAAPEAPPAAPAKPRRAKAAQPVPAAEVAPAAAPEAPPAAPAEAPAAPKPAPVKGKEAAPAKGKEKKAKPEAPPPERVPSRLKERYRVEIVPALMKQFSYRSVMQAPRVTKVVVNMGVGAAIQDAKALEGAMRDLSLITGQKGAIRRAKKSVAQFRLRKGMAVGCMVTLRGERMYDFMDRLFNVALPRIRDFRGLAARAMDGRGNYTLGLREQLIFPEIDVEQADRVRGMDVTLVTSARSDEEARALLSMLGLPLRET